MSRWYWENHPGYDALRAVDGELDDVSPEEHAHLAAEASEEWREDEEVLERMERDRAERGSETPERRA